MAAIVAPADLPDGYQKVGQAINRIADCLVPVHGAPAVLSALLSTYLQIALDTGNKASVLRMLPFAVAKLDELEVIRAKELGDAGNSEGQL